MNQNLGPRNGRYSNADRQKSGGETFTPNELADFVAQAMLRQLPNAEGVADVRLLDPAVGDGELLIALLAAIKQHCPAARPVVTGFDVQRDSIETAAERLRAAFPEVQVTLRTEDFLCHVLEQGGRDKYDLVIANPPYVRTQILGADRARQLASAFGLSGRTDLSHAFLIAMTRVLAPKGVLGVITSNRFMTTKSGGEVRRVFRNDLALEEVWDFGDTRLFDAAVLPVVVIAGGAAHQVEEADPLFVSAYETDSEATIAARSVTEAIRNEGVVGLPDGRRLAVVHGLLSDDGKPGSVWRLSTDKLEEWLSTVERNSWGRFRDVGKVRVGVKTCADKVFIRHDWSVTGETEPELLRPLTTHHIARRYRPTDESFNGRRILYPHESFDGRRRPMDLDSAPVSLAYLEAHREVLEARRYVIDSGRRWYEIWVPQDPARWAEPKVVFRDISETPTFWMDESGSVVNGDCYWITDDEGRGEEALWLVLAIANSKFGERFYDAKYHNKLYAGRRRYISQYVENFPLPDPSSCEAASIVTLAKRIHEATGVSDTSQLELDLEHAIAVAFGLASEEPSR